MSMPTLPRTYVMPDHTAQELEDLSWAMTVAMPAVRTSAEPCPLCGLGVDAPLWSNLPDEVCSCAPEPFVSLLDIEPIRERGVVRIGDACSVCGAFEPVLGKPGKGRPMSTFAVGYFCRGHAMRVPFTQAEIDVYN